VCANALPHARAWGSRVQSMFPIKDNIPRERFPLVTVILIAIDAGAYLLSSHRQGLLPFLLDIGSLALLGPSVEDALGRSRFCVFCLLGGLLALAAMTLAGAGSLSPVILGASGAIVAVLAGYLLLYPRARVLTLVVLPFFTTIVEVPAALLLGLWLLLQVFFGVAGLNPIGTSGASR
jgi:membrane associated rhomboid family serine protease